MNIPEPNLKLYKYKAFNSNSLRSIMENEVYYSRPYEFNDPLDCNPVIHNNLEIQDIAELVQIMLKEQNGTQDALRRFRRIKRSAREYGDYRIEGSEARIELENSLTIELRALLDVIFRNKGILCASSVWDSILMWSHYGDQHRGLCIEYTIDITSNKTVRGVDYSESRAINSSGIFDWIINKNKNAESKVLSKYFYTKSPVWDYEQEWRDVRDNHGKVESQWRITGIYLGYRCDAAVKSALANILSANDEIELWDIEPHREMFRLNRYPVEDRSIRPLKPATWVRDFFDDLGNPADN